MAGVGFQRGMGAAFCTAPTCEEPRPTSARGPKGAGATHGQWEGAARTSTLGARPDYGGGWTSAKLDDGLGGA
jgi:hypothetical protein